MKKNLFQLVTTYLGLFIIVSPLSAIAQTSPETLPPVNCQEQRDSDVQLSISQLEDKARKYANSKNKEQAAQSLIQVFRNLRRLENVGIKAAVLDEILALESSGMYSRLLADTVDLYSATSQKQQVAPMLAEALQTVQSLNSTQSYIKTKSLAALALHYAAIGQTEPALKILEQSVQTEKSIQGTEFKTQALTTIAQSYIAVAKIEQASGILAQSLRYAKMLKNQINTDSNPYRQGELLAKIAETYATARQYNQALQVAQLITNARSYKATAIATIARQYGKQAELDQALKTAQMIENHQDTVEIKANILAEIGTHYIHAGKQNQAAKTFNQAVQTVQIVTKSSDFQSRLLSEVIIKYAQAGQPDAALQLIPKISSSGFKARTLAAIAISYAKIGQQAKASQSLSQTLAAIAATSDANQKSDARTEIIRSLVEAKRFEFALLVAQPIEDEFAKSDTLRDIGVQAADAGQNDVALKIVQAIDTKFVDYRNMVLHRVALAYVKAGQYDQAIQVARIQDSRTKYPAKTLAAIATLSFKAKQSQRASVLFTQALQAANAIEDTNGKIEGLGAVALEYANTQQLKQASEIISQLLKVAQTIPEANLQSAALRETGEQFTLAQHYDLALLIAQGMNEPYERSSILNGILLKSIEAGNYTKADQIVNSLQTPEAKASSLIAIARTHIQTGNTAKGFETLSQALQITRTIEGPESKTLVFGTEPQLTIVDDDSDRGSFLEAIALEYAKSGQLKVAQQVTQLLEDQTTRTRLNQRLACYQSR